MADGADGRRIPILDAEIDLPRPFLAGVGAGDWSELLEQAREMAKEVELRPQEQEISRGHRRADIGSSGGADDHFGLFCRIDAELHEAVEETAIPGDVIFAAAAKHERPIKADGKIGFVGASGTGRASPSSPNSFWLIARDNASASQPVVSARAPMESVAAAGKPAVMARMFRRDGSTCYPLRS